MDVKCVASCLSLLVMLLLAACVRDILAPLPTLPESRGTQVVTGDSVALYGEFGWSADGRSIFFQPDTSEAALMVAPIEGGEPAQVDEVRDSYRDVHASADGSALFFTADEDDDLRTVYRLPLGGGTAQAIGTTRAEVAILPSEGSLVLPAPSGDSAAVVIAPDSLFLIGTAGRRYVAECDRLLVFSPAGDAILCRRGSGENVQFGMVSLATGIVELVDATGPEDTPPSMLNWTAAGLEVLYSSASGLFIRNVDSGATTQVWTMPRTRVFTDPRYMAWTTDGATIAFWTHLCLDRSGAAVCARGQSQLHLIDRTGATDRIVAVAEGAVGGQYLAFSRDGARIAYVFEKGIYHVATR